MPPLFGRQKQSGRPEDMGAGVAAGQVAAPVQPQQRQQGPGWVDFGRLLSANRAGSQRMASSLISGVRKEGQAVDDAIQQGDALYRNTLKSKTTTYSPKYVTTEDEARGMASGTFQGPKSWDEAGIDTVGLAGKAAAVSDKAKNLTSDYGRAALLRAQVKGPYSAGMSGMDAALAGAAGGNALRETANMYGGASAHLQKAMGNTSAYDKAAREDAGSRARYGALAESLKPKHVVLGKEGTQAEAPEGPYSEMPKSPSAPPSPELPPPQEATPDPFPYPAETAAPGETSSMSTPQQTTHNVNPEAAGSFWSRLYKKLWGAKPRDENWGVG